MRIKNESQRMFFFNGGSVAPGKVVDIEDKKIAEALIKGYPGELFCLDTAEVEVIPAAPKAEAPKAATRKAKSKK